MMFEALPADGIWTAYKPFIIAFAVMAVLAFVLLRLLISTRRNAEAELERLYRTDAGLYLERLENNRLLGIIFRKPIMLLYKLDGCLKTGDDDRIRELVSELDGMKLEPRDKVEYYQRRMSFFISAGETDKAKESFEKLSAYLRAIKADEAEQYRAIIDEGQEIIRVYLDKDLSYMDELARKAENTEHPILRGVIYFRLAKLAYFKGDTAERERYLRLAAEKLSGTGYDEIIRQAFITPEILEIK